jgi:gluconate 2-dehydrogenase gamma chain
VSGARGGAAPSALAAALERILPEDEHGPGAAELGATGFVEAWLAGADRERQLRWAESLAALDECARVRGGAAFGELTAAEQDALLSDVAEGREESVDAAFFDELRGRLIEGAFSDPAYGGNAGGAGWRLLGYDGPRHVRTADDQRIA